MGMHLSNLNTCHTNASYCEAPLFSNLERFPGSTTSTVILYSSLCLYKQALSFVNATSLISGRPSINNGGVMNQDTCRTKRPDNYRTLVLIGICLARPQ